MVFFYSDFGGAFRAAKEGDRRVKTPKDRVATSIVQAQIDLEQALSDLEQLPVFDPGNIAFAAHALHNFLTVIEGGVGLLMDGLHDHPDKEIHTWLEGLQHAAGLMTHTVSQLMSTSAHENPTLRRDKVNLPLLAERASTYYQRIADRKRIRLTCESHTETPYAWTDRVAVVAVMDNLLSNAVKFSEPGKAVRIGVTSESGHLVCSVEDEGPGLTKSDRKKLFRRGVRLSAEPTGGEPSTGYGLAVAKELINGLDGEIWCESESGRGARFSFRLPVYREDPAVKSSQKSEPA
jgi:signal transduction histidine kinase